MSIARRKRVACVMGTRPEAIKLAPVLLLLRNDPEHFDIQLVATAQHREMLDQVLKVFSLSPDVDMNLMRENQSLADLSARVLQEMTGFLLGNRPDVVLIQGDTTTVMATAIACHYTKTALAHVEAGLRTGDLYAPFPEEFNRRVASIVATHHFAPTQRAAANLLAEGVRREQIHVTGNTVIDALLRVLDSTQPHKRSPFPAAVPYVLMTCHRRELFGASIRGVFRAVRDVFEQHPEVGLWYPVHPNPEVSLPAKEELGRLPNVCLDSPLDYISFCHAMKDAAFLLSDSGGVQEEAPALGKRVLVLRDRTERPEGITSGHCKLVGTDPSAVQRAIEESIQALRSEGLALPQRSPYGDGKASERVRAALLGEPYTPWTG